MKNLFITILMVFWINANSQNITVYDLATLNQIHDINLISDLLVNSKGFTYKGNFGKNEGGWDIFKYSKNDNIMEIGIATNISAGVLIELTNVIYYISDKNEYDLFYRSLPHYNFEKKEVNKFDDGTPYELWRGTNSLKDQMTTLSIAKYQSFYKVYIF
jgi:hypothetical protein